MYMKYTSSPASFNLFIPELNLPALPASMTWPSILDTKKQKTLWLAMMVVIRCIHHNVANRFFHKRHSNKEAQLCILCSKKVYLMLNCLHV